MITICEGCIVAYIYVCSFVSVIHLAVGVVYCLGSWAVGLPKRAVSGEFPQSHATESVL